MDKLGVDEKLRGNDKLASTGECPECGAPVEIVGKRTLVCPNCGTEPFEG